jgi:predicted DNA-binding protein
MSGKKARKAGRTHRLGADVDLDATAVLDGDGRRITERRAQEIADEVLREVRRGRPSLGRDRPGTSPHVSFRVPVELRAKAERKARAEGKSVSQVAREALERHVS